MNLLRPCRSTLPHSIPTPFLHISKIETREAKLSFCCKYMRLCHSIAQASNVTLLCGKYWTIQSRWKKCCKLWEIKIENMVGSGGVWFIRRNRGSLYTVRESDLCDPPDPYKSKIISVGKLVLLNILYHLHFSYWIPLRPN